MTAPRRLTCDEAFRQLDDYVDRELTEGELAAIEQHLDTCRRCADEFDTEQQLLAVIRAKVAQIRIPGDLMARISERLKAP